MTGVKEAALPITRLTPDDGSHYYFGYYDLAAFDRTDTLQLYHRAGFMDRLPEPGDRAELGCLDLHTGERRPFAETNAWNFQQGSLLQWTPGLGERTVMYNDYAPEEGYFSVLSDVDGKRLRTYPRPIAAISPDNRYAVSFNFLRVYDFRPGYGYCHVPDPNREIPQPDDDGVWLMDLQTGETRLILTYPQLGRLLGLPADVKLVVNHITFNTTSDRVVMLVRDFGSPGVHWKTAVVTMDLKGELYLLRPLFYASHYHWRDSDTLMIFSDMGEGRALFALKDRTQERFIYGKELFTKDIHCSYSPDREFILGDCYEDEEQYRPLYLYHIASGRHLLLGRFYAPPMKPRDIRCDLHARWSHDGSFITFDSIHEGFRAIYRMELREALERLKKG